MHELCWAAKVTAWLSCASTSTQALAPKAAINAKRSTEASAAISNQAWVDKRINQRP